MKIAIIDIDGVLNNYPQTELDFYNNEYNTSDKKAETLTELKNNLSYVEYKTMKQLYRLSDYKHKAEPKENSKELLQYLHKNNYLVCIVTARELFKWNQLEKTILWLQNNSLYHDYLYCSQKKDFTIFERFGHVDLVIEDNCDNVNNIGKINGDAKYYIVDNVENISKNLIYGKRVKNLKEIIEDLKNGDEL